VGFFGGGAKPGHPGFKFVSACFLVTLFGQAPPVPVGTRDLVFDLAVMK
jgi:hypothetical protein